MKIGISKNKITPKNQEYMCGFLNRKSKFENILDDLYLGVIYFESKDLKSLWVSIETLIITRSFSKKMRKLIKEKFDIEIVMFSATHTHSAPVIENYSWLENSSFEYQDMVIAVLIETIKTAILNKKTSSIFHASSHYDEVGKNRLYENVFSKTYLNILVFKDENINGILIQYNTHPTVLGENNLMISGDYVSSLITKLESHFKVPCIFFQGPSGDISTRFTRTSSDLNFEKLRFGNLVYLEVLRIFKDLKILESKLVFKTFDLEIDFREIENIEDKIALEKDLQIILGYEVYKKTFSYKEKLENIIEISLFKFGEFCVFFVAGEPYSSLQDFLELGFIIGYSNGYPGYIYDYQDHITYEEASSLLKNDTLQIIKNKMIEIL